MTEKTAQKEPGKKPVPSKKPKPQQEVVVQIPLSELHPFPDHPFQAVSYTQLAHRFWKRSTSEMKRWRLTGFSSRPRLLLS